MIAPARAFFRPGERVEIPAPGSFRATIWHLDECVARLDGVDALRWQPPAVSRRGYLVQVRTGGETHWTAFDVLDRWTDAPRYGFLFDFRPERADFNLDWLLARHVNGLQFYDWMYRHDTLLPPETVFDDPLGRRLSLDTARALIQAAHARSMAAMPYTAVYAASHAFAERHREWGLYDAQGVLIDFGGFLKIMNPASGWRAHFAAQCASALDALPFDGVHIDQYGAPKTGFDAHRQPVNVPEAIADALRAVHAAIPEDKAVLFNLVDNWPVEMIARTPVDFLYSELWPPQNTLGDLARVAELNRAQSGGRVPVIAAYVNPAHERTVKLAQSVILASGAYHIAHGEDGLYLCDPYFPKAQRPSPALAAHLKRLADFGVAYEELLTLAEPADARVSLSENLWCIARRRENRLALNLIHASPADPWNEALPAQPAHHSVQVEVEVEEQVRSIWRASPDVEAPPQSLAFTHDSKSVRFTVPQVDTWTLVGLQLT